MSLEKQGPEKEQLRQCPLSDQGAGRAQHSTTVPAISPGGGIPRYHEMPLRLTSQRAWREPDGGAAVGVLQSALRASGPGTCCREPPALFSSALAAGPRDPTCPAPLVQ